VPYYSKQEKENKMTKKYRTKQTVIDEQAVEIEGLKKTIEGQCKDIENLHKKFEEKEKRNEEILSWRDTQLKNECEKLHEIRNADVVITVFEEDYHVNHPAVILSQTSLYKEDFYIDQPAMVEKALKLRDSLSEFYQHHNMDVCISVSINSI
jgi:hypothetical protein